MSDKTQNYSVQGYNLVTLLKRLEAATSRLEDVTIFQEKNTPPRRVGPHPPPGSSLPPVNTGMGNIPSPVQEENEGEPLVVGFEEFIERYLMPFQETSDGIDKEVGEMVNLVVQGFKAEKNFLELVSLSKPTPQEELLPFIKPIQDRIIKVMNFKERYRGKLVNHINTVNEFVPILGWVVVPCMGTNNKPFLNNVNEIAESSKFWSNRVMKEYKDYDIAHVEWVTQLNEIFAGLKGYINEFHSTGLAWNIEDGTTMQEAYQKIQDELEEQDNLTYGIPKSKKPIETTNFTPAPPPPPPPLPPASVFEVKKEEPKTGVNAIFSDLNRGTDITKNLKKVDKSQMTHKNPELRKQSPPVPKKPKKPSSLSIKPVETKKEAKKELIDSKWMITGFTNIKEIINLEGDLDQSIFIGNCNDCTIKINGKVNAITVSDCGKIGILTDSLISGIDIIKTKKFQFQPLGFIPMINVDQSHDGEIYLNKENLKSKIFSSQSTSLNVYTANENDDFDENPLAEQFIHEFDEKLGKFTSKVVIDN